MRNRHVQKTVHMGQDEIIRWLLPDDSQLRNFTGRKIWNVGLSFYQDKVQISIDRDWWGPRADKSTRENLKKLVAKGVLVESDLYGYALSAEYLEAHQYSMDGSLYHELDTLRQNECDNLKNALDKIHTWNRFVYLGTDKAMRFWHHAGNPDFEFIDWQGKLNGRPVTVSPMNTKDAIEDCVRWHEAVIQQIEREMARADYALNCRIRSHHQD